MSEAMDALVKEYNQLTGKSVKRFASVEIGQQRLEKAKHEKANPKPKKPPTKETLAKAASRTWEDGDVAKHRAARHSVTVNGTEYKSLSKAFKAIGIKPIGFVGFRVKLKREGKAVYTHEGKAITFTATKKEKKAK